MATQLHTFAKLSGKTGDIAYHKVKEWSQIEAEADRRDRLFPRGKAPEVIRFVKSIRKNLADATVLHLVEFLDTWSIATSRYQLLSALPGFALITNAGPFSLGAYHLPDAGRLQTLLKKQLRRRRLRQQDHEARLFALNLLETARACDNLCPNATIVMIREPFAGSLTDEEIIHASKQVTTWIG